MKIKKLLAIILALMMAVCVFVACNEDAATSKKDDEKKEEKSEEITDEEKIKEVVEGYEKAYTTAIEETSDIIENCKEYLMTDSDAYKTMEEKSQYEASATEIAMYNEVRQKEKMKILKIDVSENEATVKIKHTIVDEESLEEIFIEKYTALFEEYILSAWVDSNDEPLTLDVYNNELDEELQEEIAVDFEENCEEEITEANVEAVKAADTKTEEMTITLEKEDGEWFITKFD